MRQMISSAILLVLSISSSAYGKAPKTLKLSDIKPGMKAIGFSVFRGVEPEPFDVELRGIRDYIGSKMILAHISGGPMETPLEKIGAIAGMSGSPIFINCANLEDCTNNGVLVGSLSYGLGSSIKDGSNAGLTPIEYMLGARLAGYQKTREFLPHSPNKISTIEGERIEKLILLSGIDNEGVLKVQENSSSDDCDESVKSDIKPGSMVTVFLAQGSFNFGASGTVTWRDENKIYVFGHSFFGTGVVSYPFKHVSVADTIQTPFNPYKISGCSLSTGGAILIDGEHEIAGIVGEKARTISLEVALHVDGRLFHLNEEISESSATQRIIGFLPAIWAEKIFGEINKVPVNYMTRIAVVNEPEIFLRGIIPSGISVNPFKGVFEQVNYVIGELEKSGFPYNVESIKTHIVFLRNASVWKKKTAFLSKPKAAPGETIHANVILREVGSGIVKQIRIPVSLPADLKKDAIPASPSKNVTVFIQSANRFVDQEVLGQEISDASSLEDTAKRLNESLNRKTDILYIQQVVPLNETANNSEKEKDSLGKDWDWIQLDQSALRRLEKEEDSKVLLYNTPSLGHFIDFEASFSIEVGPDLKADDDTGENNNISETRFQEDYRIIFGFIALIAFLYVILIRKIKTK